MTAPEHTPLAPTQLATESSVSDEVKAELLRRRATFERDKLTALPWSEVLGKQLRKLADPR